MLAPLPPLPSWPSSVCLPPAVLPAPGHPSAHLSQVQRECLGPGAAEGPGRADAQGDVEGHCLPVHLFIRSPQMLPARGCCLLEPWLQAGTGEEGDLGLEGKCGKAAVGRGCLQRNVGRPRAFPEERQGQMAARGLRTRRRLPWALGPLLGSWGGHGVLKLPAPHPWPAVRSWGLTLRKPNTDGWGVGPGALASCPTTHTARGFPPR